MNHLVPRLTTILLLVSISVSVEAIEEASVHSAAQTQLDLVEKVLATKKPASDMDTMWQSLIDIRQMAKACTVEQNQKLARLAKIQLELGEPTKGEDQAVHETRRNVEKEKLSVDQSLGSCKLLGVRSESLLEELGKQRENMLKERLLTRVPSMISFLIGAGQEPIDWKKMVVGIGVDEVSLSQQSTAWWVALIVITMIAVAVAVYLRRIVRRYQLRHQNQQDFTGALLLAVVGAIAHYSFGLLLVSSWALFGVVVSWGEPQVEPFTMINLVLLGLFSVFILGRTFFSPLPPAKHYLPQPEDICRHFWRGLRLLAAVVSGGMLIYLLPITADIQEPLESLLRALFITLMVFSLIWVVWDALIIYGRRGFHLYRFLLMLALIVGLGAEYGGYRNLGEYLIGGIFLTLVLVGTAWLLSMLLGDFCDSLDEGRYPWQMRFRSWLGVEPRGYLPGLFWLRIMFALLVWGGGALVLLRIWDVSAAKRAELLAYVTDGFTIGDVAIMPMRIIFALGILVVLMSLIAWLKKQLDEHWLKKARMEVGARNAVASITAYTAAAIAIVVVLSFAGVELSNLAIIAGALSVGIGFGLQNIVNNFVSGLILLFERPVQKGDWVVVGNTEGYVRKISIRSTQIQTFEKADVIVPNSELISSQVTNWMLRDLRGRVKVPIGVAYGSDVEKVKNILLQIGREQNGVVLDGSLSMPKVIFLGFGASSLDFELRFFIRDIDEKMQVISDANFAIDRMFREHGIEIPFPQRDVHVRSWDVAIQKSDLKGVEEVQ